MEQLKPDCDAFWHLRNLGGPDYAAGDEQQVRDHLGRFGFQGDRAFEPVRRFSGGEKARLTLALLVARRPNLLLLDEPTNHLDIDMRAGAHRRPAELRRRPGRGVARPALDQIGGRHACGWWRTENCRSSPATSTTISSGCDRAAMQRRRPETAKRGGRSRQAPASQSPLERKAPRRDPLAKLRQQLEQVEARIAAVAAERALRGGRICRKSHASPSSPCGARTCRETRRIWSLSGWKSAPPSKRRRRRAEDRSAALAT